jgi:hypothetical protein
MPAPGIGSQIFCLFVTLCAAKVIDSVVTLP